MATFFPSTAEFTKTTSWEAILPYLSTLHLPSATAAIHKDECVVSFSTPQDDDGIYINLSTFESFDKMYLLWDYQRTGNFVYLHCKAIEIPSDKDLKNTTTLEEDEKPLKMEIGTADGFKVEDKSPEYIYEYAWVLPSQNILIPVDTPNPPEILQNIFVAIQKNPGTRVVQRVMAWENELNISRYANDLPQIENPPKIPPSQWQCTICGETQNLWLNLSDGYIGCGRKLYNYGGGCRNGEEGAAILHFKETNEKFPLAVKLGTITAKTADVFSYAVDENDAVVDPKLAEHLAHFGINIQKLEKTVKTTGELEIDQNLSYDWNKITEEDQNLELVSGSGRRGLKNLGNSCYVNSILQMLSSVDEFSHLFLFLYGFLLYSLPKHQLCSTDLAIQFGKLFYGMLTSSKRIHSQAILPFHTSTLDKISTDVFTFMRNENIDSPEENVLNPCMLRNLIGKNHEEFSSYKQQDAEEYFSYLFTALLQVEKSLFRQFPALSTVSSSVKPFSPLFNFQIEQRSECLQSHQVRYTSTTQFLISLDIPCTTILLQSEEMNDNQNCKPLKSCANQIEIEEGEVAKPKDFEQFAKLTEKEQANAFSQRLKIPLQTCFEAWASEDVREGYKSPITSQFGKLSIQNRLKTFPDYLVLHLKRFYAAEDWTAKKLDCLIEVTEELDLEFLRGTGLKAGEVLLPEEAENLLPGASKSGQGADVDADPHLVAEIVAMGFNQGIAEKACIATLNANAEVCIDWILSHPDAEVGSLMQLDSPPLKKSKVEDPNAIALLADLGFSTRQAQLALTASEGDVEVATEWLLNNADSLGIFENALEEAHNTDETTGSIQDGKGKYSLLAMVSHIGKSANSGHYVAHIKKDNQWIIFNDSKVALSQHPPLQMGYIYLFKRVTDFEQHATK